MPKKKVMKKKANGKKSAFGMLSVKAGIDKNPNPTQADRIAGATKKGKVKMMGGGSPGLPTASGAKSLISFTVHKVGAAGTELFTGASVNFS